jgi:hypothetical protein
VLQHAEFQLPKVLVERHHPEAIQPEAERVALKVAVLLCEGLQENRSANAKSAKAGNTYHSRKQRHNESKTEWGLLYLTMSSSIMTRAYLQVAQVGLRPKGDGVARDVAPVLFVAQHTVYQWHFDACVHAVRHRLQHKGERKEGSAQVLTTT